MMRHYPDLGSASDWLKRAGTSFQPIRSTTKIWVVTRHQYGISALVTQTSFCEGSNGNLAKRQLFSQAKRLCFSLTSIIVVGDKKFSSAGSQGQVCVLLLVDFNLPYQFLFFMVGWLLV